jgi:hypothetical protein
VARTFKKSFKGKAVAIVKPFSNVGEKRSPGPVKEQHGGSKADLLNLLYDFKSDEEPAAVVASGEGGDDNSVQQTAGSTEEAAASSSIVKGCGESEPELATPPPPVVGCHSSSGAPSSALLRAVTTCAVASSSSAASKRTRDGGLAKPSIVARKLKFGGAELKAVRVRVEKLSQSTTPLYTAAAAERIVQKPTPSPTSPAKVPKSRGNSDDKCEATSLLALSSSIPKVSVCEIKQEAADSCGHPSPHQGAAVKAEPAGPTLPSPSDSKSGSVYSYISAFVLRDPDPT